MMTTKTCSLCDRPLKAFGWCSTHYMRWRKYGDPTYTQVASQLFTDEERLRQHGWTVMESGCWEWAGFRHKQGYGRLRVLGKLTLAHVLAYKIWRGDVPDGMKVRHTCDNPPCINPEHLLLGTQADNVQDMVSRGRARNAKTGRLDGDANV